LLLDPRETSFETLIEVTIEKQVNDWTNYLHNKQETAARMQLTLACQMRSLIFSWLSQLPLQICMMKVERAIIVTAVNCNC